MLRSTPFASSFVSILLLAASLGVLGTGCTSTGLVSTDYAPDENVTEYETSPISIPGIQWGGGGYGSSKSLEVWATAKCQGRNCTPDQVTLLFQLSGSSSVKMQSQAVELKANGQTFGSSGRGGVDRDLDDLASAIGVVATMTMSFEAFRTIAGADQLSGSIGTSTFRLSQKRRAPFHALVQKVTAPAEPETSEGSS